MKKIVLPLVAALCVVPSFALAEEMADIEGQVTAAAAPAEADDKQPWWESGTIQATGHGYPPPNVTSLGQARNLARRAAMSDAYRALAEQAAGIRVTANQTLNQNEVNAVIIGAKAIEETFDAQGACTVVVQVPLYGVSNSIAEASLKPVPKSAFPAPTPESSSDVTPIVGNYTGLIIDCSDVEDVAGQGDAEDAKITPVLKPVVLNGDHQPIYSYENLDYDKVLTRGMVGYSQSLEGNDRRTGSNPLVIKAIGLSDGGTTPILSARDANRILAENSSSHFLDECAVMMVSTKGVRDSYSRKISEKGIRV